YSVAVEIKSRPTEKDIEHHERRLEILRQYMDKHQDRRVIQGALDAGLYVIVQSGDTMQIESPEGFSPREW
ncbi:MAG: hypothetical protein LBT11_00860, partial [Treponema sp.]|nr:hypothetical protein [Treponema sp.]